MINISGYIHADSHGFMIPIKAIVMWSRDFGHVRWSHVGEILKCYWLPHEISSTFPPNPLIPKKPFISPTNIS